MQHWRSAHQSLAWLFVVPTVLLVVYASLYPFTGWRWSGTLTATGWWLPPWPRWRDRNDELLNLLGYIPVGAILAVALWRSGLRFIKAAALSVIVCSALSYGMEVLQAFLPVRVPSLKDWLGNTAGAVIGALVAGVLKRLGWLSRWRDWRDARFLPNSAGALLCLMLWPVGLLFPTPIPFALGQFWTDLQTWSAPWLPPLLRTVEASAAAGAKLTPLKEAGVIALSVLSSLALMGAASRAGWQRLLLGVGVVVWGAGGLTLSAALNFGPLHAWSWWTPQSAAGLLGAALLGLALTPLSARTCAAVGLITLVTSMSLAAGISPDAYFNASLKAWEQGRFVRFHGLAQWVGWIWPYATLWWLVLRLVRVGHMDRDAPTI